MTARATLLAALALAGCDGGAARPTPDAAVAREVTIAGVAFDGAGLSDEVVVEVPAGTRSLTLIVQGDDEALIGLARLTTADGVERVGLPADLALPAALEAAYFDEQIGDLGGAMTQSTRLGLFTHVYPNRPGDPLPPGPVAIRLATSRPAGTVEVLALMPRDDGARTLALNVFAVSNTLTYGADEPATVPWLAELGDRLGQAGIALEIRRVINLPDTGYSTMTEVSEPQEGPASMSAALARRAAEVVQNGALDVFVVDALPPGIGGWSLGTPGPPRDGTYYSGVVVENTVAVELGRVAAHELAHYLGLGHVLNQGVSGAYYPDALDDTEPGSGNLMEGGTILTADQDFVLQRSALLR